MPKKNDKSGESNEPSHELLSKLIPDPSNPPNLTFLTGLLTESQREGFMTLYVSVELDEYIECKRDDIVHHTPFVGPGVPGWQCVWIKTDAVLRHGKHEVRDIQASFFKGRFQPHIALEQSTHHVRARNVIRSLDVTHCGGCSDGPACTLSTACYTHYLC